MEIVYETTRPICAAMGHYILKTASRTLLGSGQVRLSHPTGLRAAAPPNRAPDGDVTHHDSLAKLGAHDVVQNGVDAGADEIEHPGDSVQGLRRGGGGRGVTMGLHPVKTLWGRWVSVVTFTFASRLRN